MKKLLLLFLIITPILLHAQDPGTVVGIYIHENGHIIKGTKMNEYEVSVEQMQQVTTDPTAGEFQAFCWSPYQYQQYKITIKHGGKKMQIVFYVGNKQDFANEPQGFFFNASFRLDVEFVPGKYYKIDKFKKTTGNEWLKLEPETHEWNYWICSTCKD